MEGEIIDRNIGARGLIIYKYCGGKWRKIENYERKIKNNEKQKIKLTPAMKIPVTKIPTTEITTTSTITKKDAIVILNPAEHKLSFWSRKAQRFSNSPLDQEIRQSLKTLKIEHPEYSLERLKNKPSFL